MQLKFLSFRRSEPVGPCDPVLVYSLVPKANWRSQGWCDWFVATTTGSLWPIRTSWSVTGTKGGDGLWERVALRRELMMSSNLAG